MKFKTLSFVLLLCVAATLSGCASFRNNEIADVQKMPDVSQYKNKPSVYVESHFFRGEPGSAVEMSENKTKVEEVIRKSFDNCGLFSKYSFNEADKASSDYTIKVDIYNHGNTGLAAVGGFLCGLSLYVIPTVATDNYTLEAKLADKSGTVLSNVTNKDSISTWFGIWLIPAMGATPEKAITGTWDNQLRTVLKELVESHKLEYSLIRSNHKIINNG